MKIRIVVLLLSLWLGISAISVGQVTSPYAGQDSREIKALSVEDIDALLAGKGMGLAKAAELNGYPGSAHVLELADEIGLTPDQRAKTEALFQEMQASAKSIGSQLVREERTLDSLFASRSVTPELLRASLDRIGSLQGRVRFTHLSAHLEQIALLSAEQVSEYNRLRGYGARGGGEHHMMKHE